MKKISVVIPCYNESSGIHILYNSLKDVFSKFDSKYDFEIVFVNDGSTDNTIDILRTFHDQDKKVKVIDLSRNFGHQLALTAGLDFASGDAVVTMDADMQDPPELILDMIKKWEDGYDIVYAQRINRDVDSSFKRVTANLFYRFLNLISYVKTPNDTADFRLIDKKVLDEIKKIREHNRYIRGLISYLGFKQITVPFERQLSIRNNSHYSLFKMLKLANDGIIGFSNFFINLSKIISIIFILITLFIIFISCSLLIFINIDLFAIYCLLGLVLLFISLQMLFLSIVLDYNGRILDEVRNRPLYIIKEILD